MLAFLLAVKQQADWPAKLTWIEGQPEAVQKQSLQSHSHLLQILQQAIKMQSHTLTACVVKAKLGSIKVWEKLAADFFKCAAIFCLDWRAGHLIQLQE